MKLQVDFAANQTGVGYQFYDASGLIGARVTSGITNPRTGIYAATATPGAGAIGIYWDCSDPNYTAIEDLSQRITVETSLDAAISTRAVPGDAMALTSGERNSTAAVVESHLLDEGDSQMLINAIVGAIGNMNVDQAALIAAIRADLERSGGRLIHLDADMSSRSSHTAADVWAVTTRALTDKVGFGLSSSERNSVAAALLDLAAGVETNLTLRQALRGFAAVLMGKSTNGGDTFRDINDTKDRIAATVDDDDNRTVVVRDLT